MYRNKTKRIKHDYQILYPAYHYTMSYIVYDKCLMGIKKYYTIKINGKNKKMSYVTDIREARIAAFDKKELAEEYIDFLKWKEKIKNDNKRQIHI